MPVRVAPASRKRVDDVRRAFRVLPKDFKNALRKAQRAEVGPIWKREVDAMVARAPYRQQQVIFRTGTRVKAGLPMYLIAGAGTRPLSGGGYPTDLDTAYEFGKSNREQRKTYTRRSRKGGSQRVTRRTSRQLPRRASGGYVVYPALSKAIPQIISTWVSAVNQAIYDAIDGR